MTRPTVFVKFRQSHAARDDCLTVSDDFDLSGGTHDCGRCRRAIERPRPTDAAFTQLPCPVAFRATGRAASSTVTAAECVADDDASAVAVAVISTVPERSVAVDRAFVGRGGAGRLTRVAELVCDTAERSCSGASAADVRAAAEAGAVAYLRLRFDAVAVRATA